MVDKSWADAILAAARDLRDVSYREAVLATNNVYNRKRNSAELRTHLYEDFFTKIIKQVSGGK